MDIHITKMLGGMGAGVVGVTGAYFGINEIMKSKTKNFSTLSKSPLATLSATNRPIYVATGKILKLKRQDSESQSESMGEMWNSLDMNRDTFIKDYDLEHKTSDEIGKLLKDVLRYNNFEVGKINMNRNANDDYTEYYIGQALRGLCVEDNSSPAAEVIEKYCKEYRLVKNGTKVQT